MIAISTSHRATRRAPSVPWCQTHPSRPSRTTSVGRETSSPVTNANSSTWPMSKHCTQSPNSKRVLSTNLALRNRLCSCQQYRTCMLFNNIALPPCLNHHNNLIRWRALQGALPLPSVTASSLPVKCPTASTLRSCCSFSGTSQSSTCFNNTLFSVGPHSHVRDRFRPYTRCTHTRGL